MVLDTEEGACVLIRRTIVGLGVGFNVLGTGDGAGVGKALVPELHVPQVFGQDIPTFESSHASLK